MPRLQLTRPAALTLLLLIAAVSLYVIELEFVSLLTKPANAIDFGFAGMATITMVDLLYASICGAAAAGVLALWSVLRNKPLRRPIVAFAIGLAAYVLFQASATMALHNYKSLQPRGEGSPAIDSESPAATETK